MSNWESLRRAWTELCGRNKPPKLKVRFDCTGKMVKFPKIACIEIDDCFELEGYKNKCLVANQRLNRLVPQGITMHDRFVDNLILKARASRLGGWG